MAFQRSRRRGSDRRNDAGALQFGERVVVEPRDALADGGVGLGEAGESYVAQAVQDRHRIEETRRVTFTIASDQAPGS